MQKPLELCEKLIKASKNGENTKLVVPFAGSGSECVAAKKMNIKYIGFEIKQEFVVGFGLDYNQRFRNLKEIHILK